MTTALETKKITPLQEVRQTMESKEMREQIKMALPAHVPVDKFIRVSVTAISNDPKLLSADRRSFYNACMKAASDGLVPDGKEAALVTFGEQVAYMPMVSGILKKVRNSGELASITSQIVHKNDKFKYWIDSDGEHINHEPLMFDSRGEAIGVYALAKTKDGAVYIEVMDKAQVMSIRGIAKSKTVWDGAFGPEMWRKSAIRRLAKRLPTSTDLDQVIDRDNDLYDLEVKPEEQKQEETKATSSRLSKIVEEHMNKPTTAKSPEKAPVQTVSQQEPNEDPNVDDLPI